MERSRVEWDEHVTRMDAHKLVKISRDNTAVGRSPGRRRQNFDLWVPSDYAD